MRRVVRVLSGEKQGEGESDEASRERERAMKQEWRLVMPPGFTTSTVLHIFKPRFSIEPPHHA
jgi:hypothetical protein